MKPVLKSIFTYTGQDILEYAPEIKDNFCVLLHITIGPDDQDGGHDYNLRICSPVWLEHTAQHEGAIWGRHLLIAPTFDSVKLRSEIEKIIAYCGRTNWAETSVILSRFFAWEYEDYQS